MPPEATPVPVGLFVASQSLSSSLERPIALEILPQRLLARVRDEFHYKSIASPSFAWDQQSALPER